MHQSLQQALLSCNVSHLEMPCNIVVREYPNTSGQFLVTHFLCSSLVAKKCVLFLTLQHTFSHNCACAAKVGTKLLNYYKEGTIKVIEGQRLMTEAAAKILEGQDVSLHPFSFIFNNAEKSLRNLFNLMKNTVSDWRTNNTGFTIIIDNLSAFLSLGLQPSEVTLFVQYCNSLLITCMASPCKPWQAPYLGSLILLTMDDPSDSDAKLLAHTLSYSFDVTLTLTALVTGKSVEVDGMMEIINWSLDRRSEPLLRKALHYKVHEKDVQLFAPGTATSVL